MLLYVRHLSNEPLKSRLKGLVIEWEGVRHPILPDLSWSSRLTLAKNPCHVKVSKKNIFASKSIFRVKMIVRFISCESHVKVIKHVIQENKNYITNIMKPSFEFTYMHHFVFQKECGPTQDLFHARQSKDHLIFQCRHNEVQ